jgi:two-component system alkaline phosphatase synthesis response regulator PhoP
MPTMQKILIADDDIALVEMYKIKLEESFFEVIAAYDGEEALQKARDQKPDLILLDMVLPKKSGDEVLLELKNDPLTADIPVIIFSNLGGKIGDMNTAEAYGAVDLLIKSEVEPRHVVEAVKKALGRKGVV